MRHFDWLMVAMVSSALAAGAACSSKQRTEPVDPPLGEEQENPGYELAAEWNGLAQRLCEKLTECAFEDAERNLPPEEVAKLRDAGPVHTRECAREYRRAAPSRRQLDGIANCLDDHSSCEPLLECMDRTGAPAPG